MTFGQQLDLALSMVPHTTFNKNSGNLSYGDYLRAALKADSNASGASLLQAIATAGWNSKDPNYGSTITNGIKGFFSLITCLEKSGYFK